MMTPSGSPTREMVILVDPSDQQVGVEEKLAAHRRGVLHRAVSVFVFDQNDRLLLQRRAAGKYHSPELWSNTCCGHPRPGETSQAAAVRRLHEEMGIECALEPTFSFIYRADLSTGLIEHELDHVFVGRYEGDPKPDPREVGEWRWMALDDVSTDLFDRPDAYTVWFRILMREHLGQLTSPHSKPS